MNAQLFTMGVICCALLTGCGSGAGFDDLASRGTELWSEYDEAPLTAVEDLPSGSVSYSGVAAFSSQYSDLNDIYADPSSVAAVSIDIDFSSGNLNGRMDNFQSASDQWEIDGSLTLSGAQDESELSGTISGTLSETYEGHATYSVNYDGSFVGYVGGEQGEVVAGAGSVVASGVGITPQTVNGIFIADAD